MSRSHAHQITRAYSSGNTKNLVISPLGKYSQENVGTARDLGLARCEPLPNRAIVSRPVPTEHGFQKRRMTNQ